MTQIVLSALRCLPVPKPPQEWGGTALEETMDSSFFATILLPVSSSFSTALVPWLLMEGYLDNNEWELVKDCPTFQFATKIYLSSVVTMEFTIQSLEKISRFVKYIAKLGDTTSDPRFRQLVLQCPYLEDVRFGLSASIGETDDDKIAVLETAAFVAKNHPSMQARASAACNFTSILMSMGSELSTRALTLTAAPPPPSMQSPSSTSNVNNNNNNACSFPHLFDFFNSVKKDFITNGLTGSQAIFAKHLHFFASFIGQLTPTGFLCGYSGEAEATRAIQQIQQQQQQQAQPAPIAVNISATLHRFANVEPNNAKLAGRGGDYASWGEIFDVIEALFDSGDFKYLSDHSYGVLMKLFEHIVLLKGNMSPPSARTFFWRFMNDYRETILEPLLKNAKLIRTREQFDELGRNVDARLRDASWDILDTTRSFIYIYSHLVPDHYWNFVCGGTDIKKSGSNSMCGLGESERLTAENFEQMWKEQKRRSLEHIPFEYLIGLQDLANELLFDENALKGSDEDGKLFSYKLRKSRLELKYEEIREMFARDFAKHMKAETGKPDNNDNNTLLEGKCHDSDDDSDSDGEAGSPAAVARKMKEKYAKKFDFGQEDESHRMTPAQAQLQRRNKNNTSAAAGAKKVIALTSDEHFKQGCVATGHEIRVALNRLFNFILKYYKSSKCSREVEFGFTPIMFENDAKIYKSIIGSIHVFDPDLTFRDLYPSQFGAVQDGTAFRIIAERMLPFLEEGLFSVVKNLELRTKWIRNEVAAIADPKLGFVRRLCEWQEYVELHKEEGAKYKSFLRAFSSGVGAPSTFEAMRRSTMAGNELEQFDEFVAKAYGLRDHVRYFCQRTMKWMETFGFDQEAYAQGSDVTSIEKKQLKK